MRKFLLSSEKFTGSIEVLYNEVGNLVRIDLIGADGLTPGAINQLITAVIPAHESKIAERMTAFTTITCIESDFHVSLEDFKREYPYQRNMHLLPAIWEKLSVSDKLKAWQAAKDYRKYCQKNATWNYRPKIAAAWLKDREYLNDWKTL